MDPSWTEEGWVDLVTRFPECAPLFDQVRVSRATIGCLMIEQADKLRLFNSLFSATGTLPDEVLSTIFRYACPPLDLDRRFFCSTYFGPLDEYVNNGFGTFDRFDEEMEPYVLLDKELEDLNYRFLPVVLSSVCHRWRDIALSTPRLWNSAALEIDVRKLPGQISILRHYLAHSDPIPFTLDIDFARYYAQIQRKNYCPHGATIGWRSTDLAPIKSLLISSYGGRIHALRIANPPATWIVDLSSAFPRIVHFGIGWLTPYYNDLGEHSSYSPPEVVVLPTSPSLRHLSLARTWDCIRGSCPLSITTLHLYHIPFHTAIDLLLSCTHLGEFHNYHPTHPFNPKIYASLTFINIFNFAWTWQNHFFPRDVIVQHLRLPNLQHLRWGHFPGPIDDKNADYGDGSPVQTFFSNLPDSLQSLDLFEVRQFEPDDKFNKVVSSLAYPKQVKRLSFTNCSQLFIQATLLAVLTQPRAMDEKDQDVLLPSLKEIYIQNVVLCFHCDPPFRNVRDVPPFRLGDLLAKISSEGRKLRHDEFQLEFTHDLDPEDLAISRSLTQKLGNGLTVKILESGIVRRL